MLDGSLFERELVIDRKPGRVFEGFAHQVEAAKAVRTVDLDRPDLRLPLVMHVSLDLRCADVVRQRDQVDRVVCVVVREDRDGPDERTPVPVTRRLVRPSP